MARLLETAATLKLPAFLSAAGVLALFFGYYALSWDPWRATPRDDPAEGLVVVGAVLAVAGVLLALAEGFQDQAASLFGARRVKRDGAILSLELGSGTIRVLPGRLEVEATAEPSSVVILPANEFFDDECLRDTKSALGAFVNTCLPGQSAAFQEMIQAELRGLPSDSVEKTPGRTAVSYGVGTAVLLKRPLGCSHNVLVVSVTTQRAGVGLRSDLANILGAVSAAAKAIVDHRFDTVWTPLIGGGHGKVRSDEAFVAQILGWADALRSRSLGATVNVVVYRPEPAARCQLDPRRIRSLLGAIGTVYRRA